MKKQFLPYYLSRALLSAVFAIVLAGFTWKAFIIALVFFGLFLLYLHSGWFEVRTENKLFPLRRDSRGQLIQRKALIYAVILGVIAYFSLTLALSSFDIASGNIAFAIAVIAYFTSQFVLLAKN
jgi:hypothetical protein